MATGGGKEEERWWRIKKKKKQNICKNAAKEPISLFTNLKFLEKVKPFSSSTQLHHYCKKPRWPESFKKHKCFPIYFRRWDILSLMKINWGSIWVEYYGGLKKKKSLTFASSSIQGMPAFLGSWYNHSNHFSCCRFSFCIAPPVGSS